MSPVIQEKVKALTEALLTSEEYNCYLKSRDILMQDEDLYRKVCDFRKKNFFLQTGCEEGALYHEVNHLQTEFAPVRADKRVREFLHHELSLCKMIQEIDRMLTEKLDFDLDVLE